MMSINVQIANGHLPRAEYTPRRSKRAYHISYLSILNGQYKRNIAQRALIGWCARSAIPARNRHGGGI